MRGFRFSLALPLLNDAASRTTNAAGQPTPSDSTESAIVFLVSTNNHTSTVCPGGNSLIEHPISYARVTSSGRDLTDFMEHYSIIALTTLATMTPLKDYRECSKTTSNSSHILKHHKEQSELLHVHSFEAILHATPHGSLSKRTQ